MKLTQQDLAMEDIPVVDQKSDDFCYVVVKHLTNFFPVVLWNTSHVPIKAAVSGEIARILDFLVYADYFLLVSARMLC